VRFETAGAGTIAALVAGLLLLGISDAAHAESEARIRIDQARALAGGVTTGDAPGFPVYLSQPGSYLLVGNLEVSDAEIGGIQIAVTDGAITLDLNGFQIRGPVKCEGEGAALRCKPAGGGVGIEDNWHGGHTIKNGQVRGFAGGGLRLREDTRVEGLVVIGNGGTGLYVRSNGVLLGNVAARNGGDGIQAERATVRANALRANRGHGLRLEGGLADGNVASGNGGRGIEMTAGSGFRGNVVEGNAAGPVSGGSPLGANLCNAKPRCP
jgi:hypothetical protein